MPLVGCDEPQRMNLVEDDGYYASFYVRAVCDYEPKQDNMLVLRKGMVIHVLSQMESGWWDGLLDDNTRGWFPSNHVELLTDAEAAACLGGTGQELDRITLLAHVDATRNALGALVTLVRSTTPQYIPDYQKHNDTISRYVQLTACVVSEARKLLHIAQHGQVPLQSSAYTDMLVRESSEILSFIVLLMRELSKKLYWSPDFSQGYQEHCLAYTSEQQTLFHHASRLHGVLEEFLPETRTRRELQGTAQSTMRLGLSAEHVNLLTCDNPCDPRVSINAIEPLLVQLRESFEALYTALCGQGVLNCGDAWVGALRSILQCFCTVYSFLHVSDLEAPLSQTIGHEGAKNATAPLLRALGKNASMQNETLSAAQALYLTAQSVLLFSAHRPGDSTMPHCLLSVARAFEMQVKVLQAEFLRYLELIQQPGTPDAEGGHSSSSSPIGARLSTGTTSSSISSPENSSVVSDHSAASPDSLEQVPNFLECDIAPESIVYAESGAVKGGTLAALVAYLTKHDSLDARFTASFLTTFKTFTTTDEFLRQVMQRYRIEPPPGLSPSQHSLWVELKQRPTRLRAFNVIKLWLETHFQAGEDEQFLALVDQFAETDLATESSQRKYDLIKRLIHRRRKNLPVMTRIVSTPSRAPAPVLPRKLNRIKILDIDAVEWARQLTLQESQLFGNIRPSECLNKAWTGTEAGVHAKGILGTIAFYNKITSWVQSTLLDQANVRTRAQVLRHFVRIAKVCFEMNNFASMWSIVSALNLTSIYRLRQTWRQAGAKTASDFMRMGDIVKIDHNYAAYRELLHKVNPPCVPFFGIYAKDLTFIEDGNADMLHANTDLINFAKRQRIAEVVREICGFQTAYNFTEVPAISEYLQMHLVYSMSDHESYSKSLVLEPRPQDVQHEED